MPLLAKLHTKKDHKQQVMPACTKTLLNLADY
jgi:hypothetical protein